MDGFADDFVPLEKPTNDVDPAAEFLAREQSELAGLGEDIAPSPVHSAAVTTPLGAINGALENEAFGDVPPTLEQDGDMFSPFSEHANGKGKNLIGEEQRDFVPSWGGGEELESPESPPVKEIEEGHSPLKESLDLLPGSVLGGAYRSSPTPVSPTPPPVREEPEKIRLWREEQEKRLKEKDAAEEVAKEELREKAKKELEEWYKQHEDQVAKTRQANRDACKSAEKELVADTSKMEPGTEWERIAKLCDFNPKTAKSSRDISRMRSIILQVKQNPPVKA